jgi:hypothetical protein
MNIGTVQWFSSMVERGSERNRVPFAVDMLFINQKMVSSILGKNNNVLKTKWIFFPKCVTLRR